MHSDFTSIEQTYFDNAADAFTASPRTLDSLRSDIIASPISASYDGWLRAVLAVRPQPERILDYCAGMGVHTLTLQDVFPQSEVVAVDISDHALQVGRSTAAALPAGQRRPTFHQGDAHALNFPDGHFDLISNFGSFSSLDFDRSLSEIERLLAPDGVLVAVETFAHNPLANLKRRINVWRGIRTQWCATHIFNSDDLAKIQRRFVDVKVEYHILVALFLGVLPFRSQTLSRLVGSFDSWLMNRLGILQRYAFKVVVTARKPR